MTRSPVPLTVDSPSSLVAICGLALIVVLLGAPSLVLVLAVASFLAWCGWSMPSIGVGIVAASIPLQERLLVSVGSGDMTVTQLTVLPLVGGWSAAWLVGRTAAPITPTVVAWGILTVVMTCSIVNAVDQGVWSREVYRWAIALALLAVATQSIRTVRDALPVVTGIATGIVIAAIESARQIITDDGPPSFVSRGVMRAYGFFGEPNPLAAYLEMSVLALAPLAVVYALSNRTPVFVRFLLPLVVVIGTGTLVLTQSRGGLLGFIAGAAVIGLLFARWSRIMVLALGAILIVMVMATPIGQRGFERFTSSVATIQISEQTTPENWSVQERIAHWRAGMAMVESEPVTGIGAGNFDARYREYTEVWRFRIPRGHAHNGPIQVAAQTGLIGLVAYLALFFVAGARIARGVAPSHRARSRALALGALGVLVAVTVHGQFDYLHGLSLNLAFVTALALAEPAVRAARADHVRTGAAQ